MKKKKIIIILIVSFVLICILAVYMFLNPPYVKADSFSLDDYYLHHYKGYRLMIEEYPSDIVLGYTPDAITARKNAVKVWKDIYGDLSVLDKPYHIAFDEENQCWLVESGMKFVFSEGGSPSIIIRKTDGKVLAVWHTR